MNSSHVALALHVCARVCLRTPGRMPLGAMAPYYQERRAFDSAHSPVSPWQMSETRGNSHAFTPFQLNLFRGYERA
ncbi:hypothetical protein NDU88_005713 [Pleurodeles waltl]|uniref:Uncharacterized protein n=1 Tax=Pleurodeles waltl TaxID=8319 RepID=A0AAV7SMN3_PLEWA|nr:hypothetical protein NDU88_005713 [Pleurodeles waltl]